MIHPPRQVTIIRMVKRLLLVGSIAIFSGCRFNVGVPTDQDLQQMQAWAAVVTPKDRAEVMKLANQHTEFSERRKVQFITGEYKRRYLKEQNRAAAHPATTQSDIDMEPTTEPSTMPGL